MPIVVDYTDLAALGQLAQATGRAQARQRVADTQTQLRMAQQQTRDLRRDTLEREKIASRRDIAMRQMELQNILSERRLASEMAQIEARGVQRAQELERRGGQQQELEQLRQGGRVDLAEMRGEFSMAQQRERDMAALERAVLRGDQQESLAVLRAMQQQDLQAQRDAAAMERLGVRGTQQQGLQTMRGTQQQQLQTMRGTQQRELQSQRDTAAMERVLAGGRGGAGAGTATGGRITEAQRRRQYNPIGGQTNEYAQDEARILAHLLPVNVQAAGQGLANSAERFREDAERLSLLPDGQLEEWLVVNPNDMLVTYVQGVLGHRARLRDASIAPPTLSPSTSRNIAPGSGIQPARPTAAPGSEPTGFESMTDDELMLYLLGGNG